MSVGINNSDISDLEFITKCIVWDIESSVIDGTEHFVDAEKYFRRMSCAIENYLARFPEKTLKELRQTKYKDYDIDW